MKSAPFQISKDSPALFFTSVTKDRLPVFRTGVIKEIACRALDEGRRSGAFLLLAYVIMLDHLHWISDSERKPADILRFVDGIMSHRVIQFLKDGDHQSSLEKLRIARKKRNYGHSLWEHHSKTLLLTGESALMQKVNYIHQNPVRAGLVERAEDYRWSSARCWTGNILPDEPVMIDVEMISWHRPKM